MLPAYVTFDSSFFNKSSYLYNERLPKTSSRLVLLALHAGLSTDEQLKVFEKAERGSRKVIISTNIAEVSPCADHDTCFQSASKASVTIDGIKYVVDCGFVKVYRTQGYHQVIHIFVDSDI